MKKIYILLAFFTLVLAGCTKTDLLPVPIDPNEWMNTRERGTVVYVDYYTGNYIVGTNNGFSVIEIRGGVSPREYDEEYAFFSSRGLQTSFNRSANYFTEIRVVDSWLSWQDARYLLDQLNSPY